MRAMNININFRFPDVSLNVIQTRETTNWKVKAPVVESRGCTVSSGPAGALRGRCGAAPPSSGSISDVDVR